MIVGETFNNEGVLWIADKVTKETNERFQWFKVVARWSWWGRMPNWHTEPRTFLMDRQRLSDGYWYF